MSSSIKAKGRRVSTTVIERVKVSGNQSDRIRVCDDLFDAGFRIVRAGPYTNKTMHPMVDASRYLIIAEREIDPTKAPDRVQ